MSLGELDKYFAICAAIASEPVCLFHLMAYERTKSYVRAALDERQKTVSTSIPATVEGISKAGRELIWALIGGTLFDLAPLKMELNALAAHLSLHPPVAAPAAAAGSGGDRPDREAIGR
jgi:hypothetical protein